MPNGLLVFEQTRLNLYVLSGGFPRTVPATSSLVGLSLQGRRWESPAHEWGLVQCHSTRGLGVCDQICPWGPFVYGCDVGHLQGVSFSCRAGVAEGAGAAGSHAAASDLYSCTSEKEGWFPCTVPCGWRSRQAFAELQLLRGACGTETDETTKKVRAWEAPVHDFPLTVHRADCSPDKHIARSAPGAAVSAGSECYRHWNNVWLKEKS